MRAGLQALSQFAHIGVITSGIAFDIVASPDLAIVSLRNQCISIYHTVIYLSECDL
jgi:hypothetical protein